MVNWHSFIFIHATITGQLVSSSLLSRIDINVDNQVPGIKEWHVKACKQKHGKQLFRLVDIFSSGTKMIPKP